MKRYGYKFQRSSGVYRKTLDIGCWAGVIGFMILMMTSLATSSDMPGTLAVLYFLTWFGYTLLCLLCEVLPNWAFSVFPVYSLSVTYWVYTHSADLFLNKPLAHIQTALRAYTIYNILIALVAAYAWREAVIRWRKSNKDQK